MTKQEEIKKMAEIVEYKLIDLAGNADDVAKSLYANGCRIVPDGGLVLTKEEQEILFKDVTTHCFNYDVFDELSYAIKEIARGMVEFAESLQVIAKEYDNKIKR